MPVRTAHAGAATVGEVLTAANYNRLPGGWIGDTEITANQTGITTQVDLTGGSVTVTVGASRRIKITAHAMVQSTVASDEVAIGTYEGATELQIAIATLAVANRIQTLESMVVLTPTTGAHTYKLTALRSSGTGSASVVASAARPTFILVEDMGPAT